MSKFIVAAPGADIAAWWPAKIRVPVDSDEDTPKHEEQTLHVRFKVLSDEAVKATLGEGGVGELLKRVTLAWRAVDAQGVSVAFERFEEIASIPYVRDGLFDAYLAFVRGSAEKN